MRWLLVVTILGACGGENSEGVPPVQCGDPSCQPVMLANGQDLPVSIAAAGDTVYWANYGSASLGAIMSVPSGGGSPSIFVGQRTRPVSLAVDASNVYWVEIGLDQDPAGGRVMSAPRSGGDPMELANAQAAPSAIGVANDSVFWRNDGDGKIQLVPAGGGMPTLVAAGLPGSGAMKLGPGGAYWVVTGEIKFGGEVKSVPLSGGTPTDLGSGYQGVVDIAPTDDGMVYTLNHVIDAVVYQWPLPPGGKTSSVVTGQPLPRSLIGAGPNLYWADYGDGPSRGSIMRFPIGKHGNQDVTTLAADLAGPLAIAVDATHVYWTDSAGNIMKVAR